MGSELVGKKKTFLKSSLVNCVVLKGVSTPRMITINVF